MRDWLTREVGGAPYWLLFVAPLAVLACIAVLISSAVTPPASDPMTEAAAAPSASPSPSSLYDVPSVPRLLVFGDSYSAGYAASPATKGYATLVGKDLGWKTDIDAVGGTGYTYGGPNGEKQGYGTRIKAYIASSTFDPNVIVLEGSQNDYRSIDTITKTVVADVKLLQKAYPSARIVLFGPAAPQPLISQLGPIDAADQAAATELQLPYISPYQDDWLTVANTKQYGYSDGAHLNTAGHAYLAKRFLADFKPLFGL